VEIRRGARMIRDARILGELRYCQDPLYGVYMAVQPVEALHDELLVLSD
jgi:hypothetical protein